MSLCSPCRAGSAWLCSEPAVPGVRGAPARSEEGTLLGLHLLAKPGSIGEEQQNAGRLAVPGRGRDAESSGVQGAPQPGGSTQGARESSSSGKWVKSIPLLTRLQVSDCSSLIQSDRIDVPPLPIDAVKESPCVPAPPSYSDSPEWPCRAGSLLPPGTLWRCCNKPTPSPRAPLPLPPVCQEGSLCREPPLGLHRRGG